ncbi:reverse transcriptase domain-containing protein [Tanacetum coccineum]
MQSLSGKLAALNRFLSRCAERSLPFFETLKNITKESKDECRWTEEAELAFQKLKRLILELSTLTTPEEKETLYVYLATSRKAVSGVLVANRNGKQTPIRYVITDQPIKQILNKPEVSGKLAKYAVELGAYNIAYIPRTAVKGQTERQARKGVRSATGRIKDGMKDESAAARCEGGFKISGVSDEWRICSKQRRDGKVFG